MHNGHVASDFLTTFIDPRLVGITAFISESADDERLIVVVHPFADGVATTMRELAKAWGLGGADSEETPPVTTNASATVSATASEHVLVLRAPDGKAIEHFKLEIGEEHAAIALKAHEALLVVGLDGFTGNIVSGRGDAYLRRLGRLYLATIPCTIRGVPA